MKIISLLIISLLLPLNGQAEIKSRELLDEFFIGCVSEEDAMFTIGEIYEYCGCLTNTISKELDTKELLDLSMEILKESNGMTEEEAENIAIEKLLQNEAIIDGVVSCLVKLYE